jgi:protein TonB
MFEYVAVLTSIIIGPLPGVVGPQQLRSDGMRTALAAAICLLLAACGGGSSLRSGASVDDVATAPRLLNGDVVTQTIEQEYPPELRAQGVGGVVRLRLLVGTDGVPRESRVLEGSGLPSLDQAATRVASVIRFEPATGHDGRPVEVWAAFPIVFRP